MVTTDTRIYQVCALHSALKLEIIGIKSSKVSAYKLLKDMFNLKGNKQKVFDQVAEIKRKMLTTTEKKIMRKYHIGVDVTKSIYVDVEATTEEEAMELAKEKAEDLLHTRTGAFVEAVVYYIDDRTD
jgi:phosphoribosylformylglycinamidine (FGAM) synthase PurS component